MARPDLSPTTEVEAGIWLMSFGWGHQPWMMTVVAGLVLIVTTGVTTERRVAARNVDPSGDRAEQVLAGTELLTASLTLRIGIGVAIIGLMTTKPGMLGSLVVLATESGPASGSPSTAAGDTARVLERSQRPQRG